MITRFLFFITFMAFIFSADTTKVSKDKYISLPLDFSIGSYGFTYGVNNNWEINLGFTIHPTMADTDKDSHSITDYISYYTYQDEEWNETLDTVTFNEYRIKNHKAFTDYSLSVGFRKFFRYKEKENNSSNFYVQTNISYTNQGRYGKNGPVYTSEDYWDIGYEYIAPPTDEPEEGDTYGEFYNLDVTETMLVSQTNNSFNKKTNLALALGCQYNAKQELFGISDLHFGMDIEFLYLYYMKSETKMVRSVDYNQDFYPYQNRDDEISETYDTGEDFYINGPSITLFLKYFF